MIGNIIPPSSLATFSLFFEQTTTTQAECNSRATHLVGGTAYPIPFQGFNSYTVIAGHYGTLIVQFRFHKLRLPSVRRGSVPSQTDLVVPRASYAGCIGVSENGKRLLHIYVMKRVSGCSLHSYNWSHYGQMNTSEAFARRHALVVSFDVLAGIDSCNARSKSAKAALPAILTLPIKPVHPDLRPWNIFFDEATGALTGITGWNQVVNGPFGSNFYFLEFIAADIRPYQGLTRYSDYDHLQEAFWNTFREGLVGFPDHWIDIIKMARVTGLLLDAGFTRLRNSNEPTVARDDGSAPWSMLLLDALLLNPATWLR